MQRTFLSSVAAKTNRVVHETKQQRSQEASVTFPFPPVLFPSYILAIPRAAFQVQKRRWPVFPHPESWVLLKLLFPVNLSSHRAQTRPQLDSQFPAGIILPTIFHYCSKSQLFQMLANTRFPQSDMCAHFSIFQAALSSSLCF